MGAQEEEPLWEQAPKVDPGRPELQVCFALLAPRTGAHNELLALLQLEIIAPLVSRDLVYEFHVLSATPPHFVAEDSTLVVFELVVPRPWPVTDWEVQQWQWRLGSDVRLVVVPSQDTFQSDAWDAHRVRWVLERVMALGPSRQAPSRASEPGPAPKAAPRAAWLAACMDRNSVLDDSEKKVQGQDTTQSFSVVEEATGTRVRLGPQTTLMSATIARDLCQHLPVSLRWRTAWRLVYSPRLHGVSLQSFYRRLQSEGPSLVFVQDHRGYVFGGFASATWHIADRYFGDGESFVFRFSRRFSKPVVSLTQQMQLDRGSDSTGLAEGMCSNVEEHERQDAILRALEAIHEWKRKMRSQAEQAERDATMANHVTSPTEALDAVLDADEAGTPHSDAGDNHHPEGSLEHHNLDDDMDDDEGDPNGDHGLEVFHWSSKDPFFLFSDLECIAMGGGSAFALYLDKDLLHGVSEPCSTFASQRLASTENFIVNDIECWVFDDPAEVVW